MNSRPAWATLQDPFSNKHHSLKGSELFCTGDSPSLIDSGQVLCLHFTPNSGRIILCELGQKVFWSYLLKWMSKLSGCSELLPLMSTRMLKFHPLKFGVWLSRLALVQHVPGSGLISLTLHTHTCVCTHMHTHKAENASSFETMHKQNRQGWRD